MTDNIPVRLGGGAFYENGSGTARVALGVFRNKARTSVTIVTPNGVEQFKTAKFDDQGVSGRLVFVSSKKSITWRPFREADGIWVSTYGVPLPTNAIAGAVTLGEKMPTETIDAYSTEDAP